MFIHSFSSFMQRGNTLLETLIALLILSMALLGFTQVGLTALRENQAAYFHSFAVSQLIAMAENLRACHFDTVCWQPSKDQWQHLLIKNLPQGQGEIWINGPAYIIQISWKSAGQTKKLFSQLTVAL